MKPIKEYIKDSKYLFDDIDKLIIAECNIDLFNGTPYFEHNAHLFESLGIFNGCKEITNYLFNKIKKQFTSSNDTIVIDLSKFNCQNKFFNKCYVHKIYDNSFSKNLCSYIVSDGHDDYNEIRWIDDKFEFIEINLINVDNVNFIYSLIMHELIHAYDDYIHIKNNGLNYSLSNKINNTNISIIQDRSNDEIIKKSCKEMIYFLYDWEQTAYIGQLNIELKGKYKNIKDVISELQQTPVYVNYKILYANYNYIIKSNKLLNEFCDVYRELNNSKKTNESIVKEFSNKFNKFWRKFINHIYQIAQTYIKESICCTQDSNEIIKMLETKGDDIDQQWLNDEKPVMTADGRQVIVTSIEMKEVPNIIKGQVKMKDKLFEYEWYDDDTCSKALDQFGNPKKPDEADKLVKSV